MLLSSRTQSTVEELSAGFKRQNDYFAYSVPSKLQRS
jgi:hypothetical protein